ncbi:MAG: hypothetical protein MK074_02750 [Phycisphaerales bacterium]|nr:hypothetical protein [Phycisphaerales bacterium]
MIALTMCALALAAAQDPDAGLGQDAATPFELNWSLEAGYAYQLRTTIDAGGRFKWGRGHMHLNGSTPLRDDLELRVGIRGQYDTFDAEGPAITWDSVRTWQADASVQWKATERWQVFGGAQVISAAADGANFGDAIDVGGAIGAVYAVNERLALGGGIGVRSRHLDDALVYPVIMVQWGITEHLRLSTSLTSGWANQTGAELAYALTDDVTVGVAAVYDYQRFTLADGDPTAPGGAGEFTMLPVAAFISYDLSERCTVSAFVGANIGGSMKITNTARVDVLDTDYESAPVVGVQGTITF